MTRLDIRSQSEHDRKEAEIAAFHSGGAALPPVPALTPTERVAKLEREIVEAAVKAKRPSDLALRLIAARIDAQKGPA